MQRMYVCKLGRRADTTLVYIYFYIQLLLTCLLSRNTTPICIKPDARFWSNLLLDHFGYHTVGRPELGNCLVLSVGGWGLAGEGLRVC